MARVLDFALLGHPVGHSVSPSMCSAAFASMGLPHVYSAIDVSSESALRNVIDDMRRGRFAGANVTLPYKRAVLDMVDEQAESAKAVGAANVITVTAQNRVIAHNTDADAIAAEIEALGAGRPKLRVVVIGAGGAGLAALVASKRIGFKVVCVTTRSWMNSEQMFESSNGRAARSLGALTALWPQAPEQLPAGKASQVLRTQWRELATQADCIIQATSAGMEGADPGEDVSEIVPWARLPVHAVAYDLVYRPRVTPFLREAKARGLCASGGLGMLVRQAQRSIMLWTGKEPPLEVLRTAADEALGMDGGVQ